MTDFCKIARAQNRVREVSLLHRHNRRQRIHSTDPPVSCTTLAVFFFFLIVALYGGVELTTPRQECAGETQAGISFVKTEDGICCVRPDGSRRTGFVTRDGASYYFDSKGLMQTGIVTIGDCVFGFDTDGKQIAGRTYVNGTLYDFSGEAHSAVSGLVELDGGLYDFLPDGRQALGIQEVDGKVYAFTGKDGMSVTGWVDEGGDHYYISDDHQERNGIQEIDGKLYRFENSRVVGGDAVENGKRYSFTGENCTALINTWASDHQYFYGEDRAAVTGIQLIDGRYYRFGDDGKLSEDLGSKEEYEAKQAAERLEKTLQQAAGNQGDAGNFCVPDLGINVALYACNIHVSADTEDVSQAVCDRQNSAVYFSDCAQPIIADHSNQGFASLANAYGKYVYVTRGGARTRYVCTGVYSGENNGTDLICNGAFIINSRFASLVAYTCNTSWRDIIVCAFEPA